MFKGITRCHTPIRSVLTVPLTGSPPETRELLVIVERGTFGVAWSLLRETRKRTGNVRRPYGPPHVARGSTALPWIINKARAEI